MANRDHVRWANEFRSKVKKTLENEFETKLHEEFRIRPGGHRFDLGSKDPGILVECKRHTWTAGDNVPEGKLAEWVGTIWGLHDARKHYPTLILAVLHDKRQKTGETLRDYFLRTARGRDLPSTVTVWAFDWEGKVYR